MLYYDMEITASGVVPRMQVRVMPQQRAVRSKANAPYLLYVTESVDWVELWDAQLTDWLWNLPSTNMDHEYTNRHQQDKVRG
jgi:hypothetical protein